MPKYSERSDFEELVSAAYEIEKQIQDNLSIHVNEINESSILVNTEVATEFEI